AGETDDQHGRIRSRTPMNREPGPTALTPRRSVVMGPTARAVGRRRSAAGFPMAAVILAWALPAAAQVPAARYGEVVPRDVREMYERGLQYLARTQTDQGDWQGGMQGPGITGMAVMVFLASGEDPNFGPYSHHVRKALRSMIQSQDAQ